MRNFIYSAEFGWKQVEETEAAMNRSFLFGDGFFETIRLGASDFCPLAFLHANRIARSARFLGFTEFAGMDEQQLRELLRNLPDPQPGSDRRIKLIFYRTGTGGYAPDAGCRSSLLAFSDTISSPFFSSFRHIAVSERVRIVPQPWGWMKSSSALPYVLAGMEKNQRQADEILLCCPSGFVVEGSFTSLCWKDSSGIHFTDRSLGGVDSCQRRFAEAHFAASGISFSSEKNFPSQLLNGTEWIAFLSAVGIRLFRAADQPEEIPPELAGLPVSGYSRVFV